MKKKNAFIFSALGFTVVAIAALLIIFGIKGDLAAFFTSKYGIWTIVAVSIWVIALVISLITEKVNNL